MNVDDPANAVAGPSTLPDSILPYLPPPSSGPSRSPPYFTSTEDLLARFHLVPAYDKYVRPFVDSPAHGGGSLDKGKGKERDLSPSSEPASALGIDADDDDADKKKKKNNYKHLIKGIPGKHSTKKDEYLTTIMQVPPKQRIPITPFDLKTQRDAFSVSLDGLKGWNVVGLIADTAQAKEDRRKRKELKRLAKAQATHVASQPPQSISTPAPPLHSTTPATANSASTPVPPRVATPKPTVAHPGSRPPIPNPPITAESPQPPLQTDPTIKRGQKRDHEDSVNAPPVQQPVSQKTITSAIVGAKAGVNGVRPRPVKKQRMDLQGQARDISIHQQPTPQGV